MALEAHYFYAVFVVVIVFFSDKHEEGICKVQFSFHNQSRK